MAKRKVYSHTKQRFVSDLYRGSFEGERWEQIPQTSYFVSNNARVLHRILLPRKVKPAPRKPFTRRCNQRSRKKYVKFHPSLRIVHPTELPGGNSLAIWENGERKRRLYMHHLVADLFQLREPGEMVLFRDGDIWNPKLDNLKVKDSPKGRLSNRQKQFCKELFKQYPSNIIIPELAARFMVAHATVWKIYKEYENESNISEHIAGDGDTSGQLL